MSGNVIAVSDFMMQFGKWYIALHTCRCSVVLTLLYVRQRVHVLVISEYLIDYFTFVHDMVIKFIHDMKSTVHDEVGLVFGIFADVITGKTKKVVFVNWVCGLDYINVLFSFRMGDRKDSKSQTR